MDAAFNSAMACISCARREPKESEEAMSWKVTRQVTGSRSRGWAREKEEEKVKRKKTRRKTGKGEGEGVCMVRGGRRSGKWREGRR